MGRRSNFIIKYSGREGSSAIISMLSAQDGIHVPLFEDLDAHRTAVTKLGGDLPKTLDQIFRSGRMEGINRHAALFPDRLTEGDAIGFKMRLQHPAEDIAPVLRANNVKVFVLSRRNFIELVSSNYFNNYRPDSGITPTGVHPQFHLSRLEEAARTAALAEINAVKVRPNLGRVLALSSRIAKNRWRAAEYARRLNRSGVQVVPVYYEDFLSDRVAFVRGMMSELGFPQDWPVKDATTFAKVLLSPASQKLTGPGWFLGRIGMQLDRLRYWKAQQLTDRLAARR